MPVRALPLVLALSLAACGSDKKLGPIPPCTAADAQTAPSIGLFQGTVVALDGGKTCVAALPAGGRYVVVPQFAIASDNPTKTSFLIGPGDSPATTTATTSLTAAARRASIGLAGDDAGSDAAALTAQERLDRALRRRERDLVPAAHAERAERMAAGGGTLRLSSAAAVDFPASRSFKVLGDLDGKSIKTSNAALKYTGSNVVVYVDVNAPTGFTDAQIQSFGKLFDETLYPIDVAAFGETSDIDVNGRIVVLMTPLINQLTTKSDCETKNEFVTGYFYGVDLLTTQTNSNKAEVFYSMVPDPLAQFSCSQPISNVAQYVPATFVHELQHMISFGQHVVQRGGQDEETWLNEGLSHVAEELAANEFLRRGRPDSAVQYIRGDLTNARSYLSQITDFSVTTYDDFGSLEERGATWLFLRWLSDLKDPTLGGTAVFRALLQTKLTGIANIEAAANEKFGPLFGAFGIALYTDSIPGYPRTVIPERFRFKTRNLRRDLAPYPLFLDPADGQAGGVTGSMVQGTMKHYSITAPSTSGVPLRFSRTDRRAQSGDLAPQVGIFRLP